MEFKKANLQHLVYIRSLRRISSTCFYRVSKTLKEYIYSLDNFKKSYRGTSIQASCQYHTANHKVILINYILQKNAKVFLQRIFKFPLIDKKSGEQLLHNSLLVFAKSFAKN